MISRPRFYRWQWQAGLYFPHPHTAVSRWVAERAAPFFRRSTLLKFNQTHRASYNLVELHTTWLSTSMEKMSLTSHTDRFAVIRPSRAHPDSTSDESRVSWFHIRMNTMATWASLGSWQPSKNSQMAHSGNLPKSHHTQPQLFFNPNFCRRSCWSPKSGKPVDVEEIYILSKKRW